MYYSETTAMFSESERGPPATRLLRITRRELMLDIGAAALVGVSGGAAAANASVEVDLKVTLRRLIGDARPQTGRIQIGLPEVADSGNSVPLTLRVESPMTAADHVRQIHVVAERNPRPWVASFTLGPRAGKAELETFMRLSDTQAVVAFAQMSDGSWWTQRINVIVTVGACESLAVRY